MAERRHRWSYSAGGRGRNRVRAFCRGCPDKPVCAKAKTHTGDLYLEWYEGRCRKRVKLVGVHDVREAARRADRLAAEFAEIEKEERAPITLARLLSTYLKEVTPAKGESKRAHDHRAARVWRAFFDAQPEPSRRSDRSPETLDRIDWDRFIEWRRSGKIPGWGPVRDRQIEYDLKFMISVLGWATGAGPTGGQPYLSRHPWSAEIRRAQKWEMPREQNPLRPSMTDEIREALIRHAPHWQFGLALRLGRATASRNSSVRHLRWSDIDLEAGTVRWRGEYDKTGREVIVPLPPDAIEALRAAPSRGIGDAQVFPSPTDPSRPTPRDTFQVWLRRAKERLLRATKDERERERLRRSLRGLGFHGEKRAAVRDPVFRELPPKVQEAIARTNYETLRRVYDEVTVDEVRAAIEAAKRRVRGT